MIEVKIPKDIRQYKPKLILGMTTRQVICGAGALAVIFFVKPFLSKCIPFEDACMFLSLLCAAPFLLCGWIPINGLPFEVYFLDVILRFYLEDPIRPRKSKNLWAEALKFTDSEGQPVSEGYYKQIIAKEKKKPKQKYKPKKSTDEDDFWIS